MSDEIEWIEHNGILRDDDGERAILFDIAGDETWLPRSLIEDYDDEIVGIPIWLAEEKDLV